MKLLLDECVPDPTRLVLERAGYQLITVKDLGRIGASNGELLAIAKQHRVTLVTADRGIGNLRRFPLGSHAGVIVLRLRRTAEEINTVHRHLLHALKTIPAEHLAGALLTVDRNKSRLRRPA